MKKSLFTLLFLMTVIGITGQPQYNVTHYDESNGLSENTLDCIIQDRLGFIWIGTWDGLNRYDGYRFQNFKARPGDRCPLANNRINFIVENSRHDIWCIVSNRPYLFRRATQQFVDIAAHNPRMLPIEHIITQTGGTSWLLASDGTRYIVCDASPAKIVKTVKAAKKIWDRYHFDDTVDGIAYHATNDGRISWRNLHTGATGKVMPPQGAKVIYDMHHDRFGRMLVATDNGLYAYTSPSQCASVKPFEGRKIRNICVDAKGNIWLNDYPGISLVTFGQSPIAARKVGDEKEEFVRAFCRDRQQRLWIADKNGFISIYDPATASTSYLSADGKLSAVRKPFGIKAYVIHQDARGNYWIGTKPDGLFRLKPRGQAFDVEHFSAGESRRGWLNCNEIYDIKEDARGRIWIATYGGGINKVIEKADGSVAFLNKDCGLKGYPAGCGKVRCLFLAGSGMMLAGTHGGLVSFDPRLPHPKFYLNARRADDAASLSNNDVTQIVRAQAGEIFLSTFGGGICKITSHNLLAPRITFRAFTSRQGLPSDVCISLCKGNDGCLWIVSEMSLVKYNPRANSFISYSKNHFSGDFIFSEVQPLFLPSGRMLVGTTQGTLTFKPSQLAKSAFQPQIIFSRVAVEGTDLSRDFNFADTLTLSSRERNISVDFAALDFCHNEPLRYAYMMEGIDHGWHVTVNHTANYLNMPPGTYRLHVRSTNGDGIWTGNVRTMTIIVKPKFSETVWATLIYILLLLAIVIVIVLIARYIYRLRNELEDIQLAANEKIQQFTDRIHELLGSKTSLNTLAPAAPDQTAGGDKAFVEHLMAYMEANISNTELSVGDFADEFCMSRTSLYRKLKEVLGCTPHEFVSDMRIKRAVQLMQDPSNNISSVAYMSGFSDPRYFSRCFKDVMGCTPTEYMKGDRPQAAQ